MYFILSQKITWNVSSVTETCQFTIKKYSFNEIKSRTIFEIKENIVKFKESSKNQLERKKFE